jgi:hypothetical protein
MGLPASPGELKAAHRVAVLVAGRRVLGLDRRVPEFMAAKGWGSDPDLEAVLASAVACCAFRAGAQRFKRPAAADALGELWPAATLSATAREIVDALRLDALLVKG